MFCTTLLSVIHRCVDAASVKAVNQNLFGFAEKETIKYYTKLIVKQPI
jgi:hypothetical protein